jgi:hypothetical protein
MLGSWWWNAQHLFLEIERESEDGIKGVLERVYSVGHSLLEEP